MYNPRKYEAHKTYSFQVYNLFENTDRTYLMVTDGYDLFKLMPYDFQVKNGTNGLPKTLPCYVKALNNYGKPLLTPSRKEILISLYPKFGQEYEFTITGVQQDPRTGWVYYELRDKYGVKHRYYLKNHDNQEIQGDKIKLIVKGIEEKEMNKAYLNLISLENYKAETNRFNFQGKFGMESETLEFKSSIVYTSQGLPDIDTQIQKIVKTIAGFMNKKGGKLLIGVKDDGTLHGIESDFLYLNNSKVDSFKYHQNVDGYELKIRHTVKHHLGTIANGAVNMEFKSEEGLLYVEILVDQMTRPIYFDKEKVYQRAGNSTQQLKGEEITWLIEEMLTNRPQIDAASDHIKYPEKYEIAEFDIFDKRKCRTSQVTVGHTEEMTNASPSEIWAYFSFYKNGDWSYQMNPEKSQDLLLEIPITESMKSEILLMVYENGKINAVIPDQMIYSLGINGKVFKKAGKRYKNGWNNRAKLEKLLMAKPKEQLLVVSAHSQGPTYYKVHHVNHIGIHTTLFCEGNILVNNKLNANLLDVFLLNPDQAETLKGFKMKEHQTSTSLGYLGNDSIYLGLLER